MLRYVEAADQASECSCFLAGVRRGSPEDVGSVRDYEEFVRAVTRPRHHREYAAMVAWHGGSNDPLSTQKRPMQHATSDHQIMGWIEGWPSNLKRT